MTPWSLILDDLYVEPHETMISCARRLCELLYKHKHLAFANKGTFIETFTRWNKRSYVKRYLVNIDFPKLKILIKLNAKGSISKELLILAIEKEMQFIENSYGRLR